MTAGERARLAGDGGVTLVELLLTVVIISTAVLVFIGAMYTAVRASDTHRGAAEAETRVRTYAEELKAAEWVDCAEPASYPAPADDDHAISVEVVEVRYWDPDAGTPGDWVEGCPGDRSPQRITIHAERASGDQRVSQSVHLVKRHIQSADEDPEEAP